MKQSKGTVDAYVDEILSKMQLVGTAKDLFISRFNFGPK